MSNLFQFNSDELLSFCAVLMRFTVLFAVLPFFGDALIPPLVKILLGLAIAAVSFPTLVASGQIRPADAHYWSATTGRLVQTLSLEIIFGLVLGFTGKLVFSAIQFGANLIGTYMGFGSASSYDPHQESHSQVVADFQMALAMLLFLALDGHYLLLKAVLESYHYVGIGKAHLGAELSQKLVLLTSEVVRIGAQLSAPMAISLFGVNVAFGVLAKAMPQLNILVLSLATSALVGMIVLFFSYPELQAATREVLAKMGDHLVAVMTALAKV